MNAVRKLRSTRTRRCGWALLAMAVLIPLVFLAVPVRVIGAGSCESLSGLTLSDSRITQAVVVPAGAKPFQARRAFCRVLVTMTPTSDSDIKAEVWLPIEEWDGKFQAVGTVAGWRHQLRGDDRCHRRWICRELDRHGPRHNTMEFAGASKYVDFGYRLCTR
jgi:hypothetical protein